MNCENRSGWSPNIGLLGLPHWRAVEFTKTELVVRLKDGRTISAPLAWFPRLVKATPAQRANLNEWATVKEFTGPRPTTIRASPVCCAASARQVRDLA